MTTKQTSKPTWQDELYRLDIADPDSKGCTITLGEYLRVDCPELEQFIQSLLTQQRQEIIKEVEGMEEYPADNDRKRHTNIRLRRAIKLVSAEKVKGESTSKLDD